MGVKPTERPSAEPSGRDWGLKSLIIKLHNPTARQGLLTAVWLCVRVHRSEAALKDVEAGLPRLREAEGAAAAAADHKREEVWQTRVCCIPF